MKYLELTIDITEDYPVLDDLRRYHVESMRVRRFGPSGNPAVTLRFAGDDEGGTPRDSAREFLANWYGDDEEDVEFHMSTATQK